MYTILRYVEKKLKYFRSNLSETYAGLINWEKDPPKSVRNRISCYKKAFSSLYNGLTV